MQIFFGVFFIKNSPAYVRRGYLSPFANLRKPILIEIQAIPNFNYPRFRNRTNHNEFNSGFQPSEQGPDVDTPPLRDGAEIIRAFSPCILFGC